MENPLWHSLHLYCYPSSSTIYTCLSLSSSTLLSQASCVFSDWNSFTNLNLSSFAEKNSLNATLYTTWYIFLSSDDYNIKYYILVCTLHNIYIIEASESKVLRRSVRSARAQMMIVIVLAAYVWVEGRGRGGGSIWRAYQVSLCLSSGPPSAKQYSFSYIPGPGSQSESSDWYGASPLLSSPSSPLLSSLTVRW